MKKRIAVVGSLNVDLVITANRLPLPSETILGKSFFTVPGGKGGNQAIAASKLAAHVDMIGCVGDDSFGKQLIKELKVNNVALNHVVKIPDSPSGVALITVSDSGDNSIVVASGANGYLGPSHIRLAEDVIK